MRPLVFILRRPLWEGACALCVALTSATALAGEVESIQPLLIDAIHHGFASGDLTSSVIRDFYLREFGTSAPLKIRVRRINFLQQHPGCARLEVETRQAGVIDRNATERAESPADLAFRYQIDFCQTGAVPDEGGA